jgi:hypothetical protein
VSAAHHAVTPQAPLIRAVAGRMLSRRDGGSEVRERPGVGKPTRRRSAPGLRVDRYSDRMTTGCRRP